MGIYGNKQQDNNCYSGQSYSNQARCSLYVLYENSFIISLYLYFYYFIILL